MNRNKFISCYVRLVLVAVMLGCYINSHAQDVFGQFVLTAKTRSGSVTYVVTARDRFDVIILSKEAGEPNDFAGAVQYFSSRKQQVVFAMNGARSDKGFRPMGLLIEGLTKHKNLALPDEHVFGAIGPSAVFAIDRNNAAFIIPANNFKPKDDLATYRLAIQSGVVLLNKGSLNRNIVRATERQVYNGIGIKANGDMVFAVTNDRIDMREFALFFQGLNCKDAMLLDEGVNCQWYAPGREKKPGKFGEIIVATKK